MTSRKSTLKNQTKEGNKNNNTSPYKPPTLPKVTNSKILPKQQNTPLKPSTHTIVPKKTNKQPTQAHPESTKRIARKHANTKR